MKNKTLVFTALFIALAGIIFGIKMLNMDKVMDLAAEDGSKVLKPAPDFRLFDLSGKEIALSDFKGKVIILDFWATWCPFCKTTIPDFIELYNKYKSKGLEIIGVSLDGNGKRVLPDFIEKYGINYMVLIGDREVTDIYGGVRSVPTTFIIDKEQRIVKKYIGHREKEIFEDAIRGLL